MLIGRLPGAVDQMQSVLHEDPMHVLCRSQLSGCLHAMGQRDEALRQVRQALEFDEDFWVAHWYLGVFRALDGALPEARIAAERAHSLVPHDKMTVGLLAGISSRESDSARADGLLADLRDSDDGVPIGRFMYHFARLEIEQASVWMEKAIEHHEQRATYMLPYMRTTTRWPVLAKKLNLPAN